jgi:hypothetical protein
MKKFLIYFFVALIAGLVCLEIIVRVFHLTTTEKLTANVDGNKLMRPGAKGIAVYGGLGEIKGNFSINNQGWNSVKDYEHLPTDKINIAIIGDSYVQGFHGNVEESIGRLLEKSLHDSVNVHEFGIAGGNIVDYGVLFEKFIKGKYDYAFIRLAKDDLIGNDTRFMGKGNMIPKASAFSNIFSHLQSIQYLKATHKIDIIFTSILLDVYKILTGQKSLTGKKEKKGNRYTPASQDALKKLDSTAFFFYEKNSLDSSFIRTSPTPCIEIVHNRTPYDHGFDRHWNNNGRKNCADAIRTYMEKNKLLAKASFIPTVMK